jgi:hypothetical protein
MVWKGIDPLVERSRRSAAATFAEFSKKYLEHAKANKRTWRNDEQKLRRELIPAWGRLPLSTITARDVQTMHNRLGTQSSPAHANRHLALIHRIFAVAAEWGHLDPDTLAAWPRTETGALSTTADDLAIGADHPALARVVAARGLSHALAGFGEKLASLVHPVTGRLHPHLLIAAQSTGRFSCVGPNMHGVPRDSRMRSLFVAGPGRAIVAADFGMVQLRIAALVSRDARLVDATERGQDLHRLTASLIMGKRPEDVTGEERSLVKPVNFGLLFCMGSNALFRYARSQYRVNMSVGDAARFREAYFRAYPGIRAWHDRIRGQLAGSRNRATRRCPPPPRT